MMSNLPQGWTICNLDTVLTSLESGARPKGGVRGITSGVPSIGGEHLTYKGTFDFSSIKYVPEEFASKMKKGHIWSNDILIVKDGATTGKTAFVDKKFPFHNAVVNEHVFICRPSNQIEPRFLFRYLVSKEGQERILENFRGSAQGGINLSFAPNTQVLLAPLNEQCRIVAKLEKLLQKVDACKERLDKIPAILKRFRQSILSAACSGRLTADWREKNPKVKTATKLLKKIQEARRENRLRNPQISQIDMDELPDTWAKTKISDVYNINPGHKGIEIDENLEVSFIPMKLIEEETGFMDVSFVRKYEEVKSGYTKFIEDDVVFAKITPCMENGKIAIAKNLCNGIGCGTTELHVFRPVEKDTNNFLFYFLLQKEIREMAKNRFQGTSGHLRVPVDFFEEIGFPLPPLEEQKEIVRRVEALFKIADQIEERYKKARAYVDKLTQSILAKAFRGELVPQDPNDEPASELLNRIKNKELKYEVNKRQ